MPPFTAGAVKVTIATVSPAVTLVMVGAPGTTVLEPDTTVVTGAVTGVVTAVVTGVVTGVVTAVVTGVVTDVVTAVVTPVAVGVVAAVVTAVVLLPVTTGVAAPLVVPVVVKTALLTVGVELPPPQAATTRQRNGAKGAERFLTG